MIPSVGRIVHYRLASHDLGQIAHKLPGQLANSAREGDVIPMLICRVWSNDLIGPPEENTSVNGQAFVDGNFSIWVTSRQQGTAPGQWSDPRG